MTAYYNEIDPYAAQWLRNLIAAGHIAAGIVDERSILDVRADDLRGYTQAHFFAGIGGWSIALRLAGWPDDRPVWTGSCPCQPFSAAGKGEAADDERHLWPAWLPLIAERRPAIVFGEQVEAAIGWGWLDAVFADLEAEGYACGAAVLPACGVGAPHIRNRLWFMADASSIGAGRDAGNAQRKTTQSDSERDLNRSDIAGGHVALRATGDLADTAGGGFRELGDATQPRRGGHDDGRGEFGILGDPDEPGLEGRRIEPRECAGERAIRPTSSSGGMGNPLRTERRTPAEGWPHVEHGADGGRQEAPGGQRLAGSVGHFWSDAEWLPCTDGKSRPVGPGSFPLGHGIRNRASKLRAYGNAIVPQTAAEFIRAASG